VFATSNSDSAACPPVHMDVIFNTRLHNKGGSGVGASDAAGTILNWASIVAELTAGCSYLSRAVPLRPLEGL
jgi:hypothetical protein